MISLMVDDVSFTNTPTVLINGEILWVISLAFSGDIRRALSAKMNPRAFAPNSTAFSASAIRVIPHILTWTIDVSLVLGLDGPRHLTL
jgi:hypothetical protein